MLQELKNFKPESVKHAITHQIETKRVRQLKSIFEQNLVLLPIDETSPLYSPDDFPEQYEPVIVNGDVVTHIKLKSGDYGDSTSINTYLNEYLQTNNVTEREHTDKCTLHHSPLPIYHFGYEQGEYMACVKLKDGYKALVSRDGYVDKGIKL